MLFLIKYLIRHLLLLLLLATTAEITLYLIGQYDLSPDTFWQTFLTHLSNGANLVIFKLLAL